MSLLVLMFAISWALAQNCRFWNSRDVNVFGISGSGLEMLILRLDPHFRYFPSHGSNLDFDTWPWLEDAQFLWIWRFEVHFQYFPGRDLNGWIWCSWGWPRRCSVSISSSQNILNSFLCPSSKILVLKLSSFIFDISPAFALTMSSFNLWS